MWWIYQAGSSFTARYPNLSRHTFYRALGTGEQGLWIIPDADLVVVHRVDTDHGRRVASEDHWALVESILAARRAEPKPEPDLQPLQPTRLSSQLPPVTIPVYRALPESVLTQYLGDYDLDPGTTNLGVYKLNHAAALRVYLFDKKPYIHLPGVGDVQMFPSVRRDTFNVRVVPSMTITFERARDNELAAVTLTLGDDSVRASRPRRR
jgi:hypothetical protein